MNAWISLSMSISGSLSLSMQNLTNAMTCTGLIFINCRKTWFPMCDRHWGITRLEFHSTNLEFRTMGYLLLEGGAEFGGRMRDPDLKAIELAGGFEAPVRIIPTAAAPDNNHQRAGNNGVRWFQSLGARDVISVPLIDKVSASDEAISRSLRGAK